MLKIERGIGIEVVDGLDKDEAERTQIDTIARRMGIIDKIDIFRIPTTICQTLDPVIDPRPQRAVM